MTANYIGRGWASRSTSLCEWNCRGVSLVVMRARADGLRLHTTVVLVTVPVLEKGERRPMIRPRSD
jgi:hypothetical protein